MLQKLNERLQGLVAWVIILLIAITFTLFGVDYYMQSRQTSKAKVVVNDHPIAYEAFEVNYKRRRAQSDKSVMSLVEEKNLKDQVLNQMIVNELIVQSARHYGFEVSPEQANAAIIRILQFQEEGHFSAQRYQQVLGSALYTPETFQNEVRQGMLLNQLHFAFMGSSFALPKEIKTFVRMYMQTRDYDYLIIPVNQLKKELKISKESIEKYYNEHAKEWMTPEQVSIDYLPLSMSDVRSKIQISKEEIKKYYDENQNNFLIPAQWQVAHILFAVPKDATETQKEQIQKKAQAVYEGLKKNPDQFANWVTSTSDDKLSLAQKGILPWIIAGQNEYGEYGKILSNLTEVNQISLPEQTRHGIEIFKLIAYKPASLKSFAEVELAIKEQLVMDMAQAQYAQSLEKLSDLSYQYPDSLNSVAEALHLPIQHSDFFSRSNSREPLTRNKQIVKASFGHEVFDLGNNSDPVQLDNDSVVVLRLRKHLPAKQLALEEVYTQIEELLMKKLAEEKAKEIGKGLLNPVDDQSLMSNYALQWKEVTQASRDHELSNVLINELAFHLSKPESRQGIRLENGDYAVVRLKAIHHGQFSTLDQEQRNSLVQQIESSYGMMDYDLYVNSLMKGAKIVRH